MPGKLPVLITTSIIVMMPEDSDDLSFAYPFGERLRETIEERFRQSPEVEYPGSMQIEPLWNEGTNVGRCERCAAWVSDYTRADYFVGIVGGRQTGNRWLCDECDTFPDEPAK